MSQEGEGGQLMKTVFIRAIEASVEDKADVLKSGCRSQIEQRFDRGIDQFSVIKNRPVSTLSHRSINLNFCSYEQRLLKS